MESQSLDAFNASATEHIFRKTLKNVMMILQHDAVFVRNDIVKKVRTFPFMHFTVILLQRHGKANLAQRNVYNLAIALIAIVQGFLFFFRIGCDHLVLPICYLNSFQQLLKIPPEKNLYQLLNVFKKKFNPFCQLKMVSKLPQ